MDKNSLCKLEVTQISTDSPIYSGTCKTCGVPVEVIETGVAGKAIDYAYCSGLKNGAMKGFLIGAFTVGILWCTSYFLQVILDDKDKDQ